MSSLNNCNVHLMTTTFSLQLTHSLYNSCKKDHKIRHGYMLTFFMTMVTYDRNWGLHYGCKSRTNCTILLLFHFLCNFWGNTQSFIFLKHDLGYKLRPKRNKHITCEIYIMIGIICYHKKCYFLSLNDGLDLKLSVFTQMLWRNMTELGCISWILMN